ncbi:hypothetical protein FQN60_009726, partial [Etheostoma spectabile]
MHNETLHRPVNPSGRILQLPEVAEEKSFCPFLIWCWLRKGGMSEGGMTRGEEEREEWRDRRPEGVRVDLGLLLLPGCSLQLHQGRVARSPNVGHLVLRGGAEGLHSEWLLPPPEIILTGTGAGREPGITGGPMSPETAPSPSLCGNGRIRMALFQPRTNQEVRAMYKKGAQCEGQRLVQLSTGCLDQASVGQSEASFRPGGQAAAHGYEKAPRQQKATKLTEQNHQHQHNQLNYHILAGSPTAVNCRKHILINHKRTLSHCSMFHLEQMTNVIRLQAHSIGQDTLGFCEIRLVSLPAHTAKISREDCQEKPSMMAARHHLFKLGTEQIKPPCDRGNSTAMFFCKDNGGGASSDVEGCRDGWVDSSANIPKNDNCQGDVVNVFEESSQPIIQSTLRICGRPRADFLCTVMEKIETQSGHQTTSTRGLGDYECKCDHKTESEDVYWK